MFFGISNFFRLRKTFEKVTARFPVVQIRQREHPSYNFQWTVSLPCFSADCLIKWYWIGSLSFLVKKLWLQNPIILRNTKRFLYKQLQQCQRLLIKASIILLLKFLMGNMQIDSKSHVGRHVRKLTRISTSQNL